MFFLTLAMALSGMTVLPFLRIGVTSTSSQVIGAYSSVPCTLPDPSLQAARLP